MTDIITLDQNLDAFADYEILPKGEYPATCVLAEVRMSDKGNEYFYINFRIDPTDYPADYDQENAPEGTTLNYSRVQVPTATDRRTITQVKKLMKALGLPTNVREINANDWVDKQAKLVVVHQTYQGETRAAIQAVESMDA